MATHWKKLIIILAISFAPPTLAQTPISPLTSEQFLSTSAQQAAVEFIKKTNSDPQYASEMYNRWKNIVGNPDNKTLNELDLVKKINSFFNQNIKFRNDQDFWGERNYWATPKEFTGYARGDCEDYAFAKYFTLIALGIPREQLHVSHAIYNGSGKDARANGSHMVLLFTPKEELKQDRNDYVLDNINPKLLRQEDRKSDLQITKQDDGIKLMTTRLGLTNKKFDLAAISPPQFLNELQNVIPLNPHPLTKKTP